MIVFFFCKADRHQSKKIIYIIRSYGNTLRQEINFSKSLTMFGMVFPTHMRQGIKSIVGITQELGMGNCSGLLEKIHGSKVQLSAFVRDRLQSRVNFWS